MSPRFGGESEHRIARNQLSEGNQVESRLHEQSGFGQSTGMAH